MLSIEQIREMLKDRNLEVVAERTGLSRQTLSNIRNSKAKSPSYSTIKTISDYLEGKNNG
jgi:transcriptional regulator with XRE-family HTH domain